MVLAVLILAATAQEHEQKGQPDSDVVVDLERAYERGVRPAELVARLRSADRLVVREDRRTNAPVLAEVTAEEDLRALGYALDVDASRPAFLCGCAGAPVFEVYRDGHRTDLVTVHHGESIRSEHWTSNAYLTRPAALARWLLGHGLSATQGEQKESRPR